MRDVHTPVKIPVIAIDGGGTRCRLALREGAHDLFVEVGAANVSTNFDAALREIRHGLSLLASQAGFTNSDLRAFPAHIGLAGVTGPESAARIAAALPLDRVRVSDDRPTALRAALGLQDGIVAHCGTGSFFAMQQGGKQRFAGGWGPILGDPASAYWVGRRALTLTLDVVDGLRPGSELSQLLLDTHQGAAGIVRFARQATQRDIAALAPHVTRLSAGQDPLARTILQEAGTDIATHLTAMGWAPGLAICLTGGIANFHAPYLPNIMQADITPPRAEPLIGALSLAQDFSKECYDERC